MKDLGLRPGEHILLQFRKHWILFLGESAGTVLSIFIPFIIYALLAFIDGVPDTVFSNAVILFVTSLWLIIVWCAFIVLWTQFYLDIWIVTDKRIIKVNQIDLFNRHISTWEISNVQEITTQVEGFLQTFLKYGTVQIQTAGPSDEHANAVGIPHPDRVRAAILHAAGRDEDLEKAAQKSTETLNTVSHEAKGYLAKDAAALATIADGTVGPVSAEAKQLAERALSETRKGVAAMKHVLDLKGSPQTELFDVRAVMRESVESFADIISKKGLTVNVNIPSTPCIASGDKVALEEVVLKPLIDNAVRYTPTGSISLTCSQHDGKVFIELKDSGVGISPSDMQRLFTEGGRGANSRDINPESTGYGLVSAKRAMTSMGGNIRAESEGVGKGSRFVIELLIA
ncbi:MAG: hypothetical protein RIQ56_213 [Candidatus Parcubacteria bacterium]|jgi:signal transduction histidine kinase